MLSSVDGCRYCGVVNQGLIHPGTRDVDVLLNEEQDQLGLAAQRLLDAGFMPSAKHEFQLILPIRVGRRQFYFNVDLLHPKEQQRRPGMFADMLDLGVPDRYDPTGKRWVKSIVFSPAPLIFERSLWSQLSVGGRNTAGNDVEMKVPLLTEAALVLSKAESVKNKKRTRDAFDIYYLITGPMGRQIAPTLRGLNSEEVNAQIEGLLEWIRENRDRFSDNIIAHSNEYIDDAAAETIRMLTPSSAE
jgi:hypothetical protein